MTRLARVMPVVALLVVAACPGDPDYTGTRYLCPDLVCPPGHTCDDGVCVPGEDGAFRFIDDDLDGELGEGMFDRTEWSGTDLRLVDGETSGEFVSRVFDAGEPADWDAIEWVPSAPYGRPLTDGNANEPGYRTGGIDMADNVLLLHLDPPSLQDTSSNLSAVTVMGDLGSQPASGVFDGALRTRAGLHLVRSHGEPVANTPDLEFGTRDFTAALWVNLAGSCATPRTFLASLAPAQIAVQCGGCPDDGRPAARVETGVVAATICGTAPINDGDWHHLAVVKRGHATATIELYVDGELQQPGETASFVDGFDLEDAALGIGALPDGTAGGDADLDEVAMWARALTSEEVASLHRRGVARVSLQVRLCTVADCSDGTFDDDQLYTDDGGDFPPTGLLPSDAARFAQYRCRFETTAGLPSPAVESVALRGFSSSP